MSLMIRNSSDIINQMLGSSINSKKGKQMLKNAGIDTNSKQYKAAMNMMTKAKPAFFINAGLSCDPYLSFNSGYPCSSLERAYISFVRSQRITE